MNLTKALAALRALAILIPVIVELAKSLDDLEGDGAAKLAIVLEAVKAAFEQIKDSGVDWESIKPLIERVIDPILKLIRSKVG